MHSVLDIAGWEREVAEAEAVAVRLAVREALDAGRGGASALADVRRRLARLTEAQREMVITGVGLAEPRV